MLREQVDQTDLGEGREQPGREDRREDGIMKHDIVLVARMLEKHIFATFCVSTIVPRLIVLALRRRYRFRAVLPASAGAIGGIILIAFLERNCSGSVFI